MDWRNKTKDLLSLIISAGLHIAFAFALVVLPLMQKKHYDTVDLTVSRVKPKVEEPVIKPEPKPEPEPQAPAPKPKAPKQEEPEPEPPPEPPPDENKPEAPPVFDLSNDTFATQGGQGSSWALNRSEGNTKFAPVAGKNQGSVRGTAPDRGGAGKNAKQGRKTVALKDLSRRPEPKNGRIELPAYPLDLRRDGIEGPVVLQVFIDPNGRVSQARIVKEPGGGLGKIAQASMLKELWTPPLDKEGNPVATVIIYTYRFVLDG